MEIFMAILTIFSLGLAFRIRGGLFGKNIGWGTTTARLLSWALPVTLFVAYWYPPILFTAFESFFAAYKLSEYYYLGFVYLSIFLGAVAPWFKSLDFGRKDGTWLKDFLLHSGRGVIWVAGLAAVFIVYGIYIPAIILLVSGLLCGVAYEIGWNLPTPFQVNREGGFNTGPEIGEFLFGALIGLALVLGAIL